MSTQIPINRKLFTINSRLLYLGGAPMDVLETTDPEVLKSLNFFKPDIETYNPTNIPQTKAPANINYINTEYYEFVKVPAYTQSAEYYNSKDHNMSIHGSVLNFYLGYTYTKLYLEWELNKNLASTSLYKDYKDKVAIRVEIEVFGTASNGETVVLETLYVTLNQKSLIDMVIVGEPIPPKKVDLDIKGTYWIGRSESFFKTTGVRIKDLQLEKIDPNFNMDSYTAVLLFADLKNISLKLKLSGEYSFKGSTEQQPYIHDYNDLELPTDSFSTTGFVTLQLTDFRLSLPKQFHIPYDTSNIVPQPSSEDLILDLSQLYTVSTYTEFHLGALHPHNGFNTNFHYNVGYENVTNVETSGGVNMYTSAVAYIASQTFETSASTSTLIASDYKYGDFVNYCLAKSKIRLLGRKNSSFTQLAIVTLYEFFKNGITLQGLSDYSHLHIELFLPDLSSVRQQGFSIPTNLLNCPFTRDRCYDLSMTIGAVEVSRSSVVDETDRGIYIGTDKVRRMFIGTKEVGYFVADKEI